MSLEELRPTIIAAFERSGMTQQELSRLSGVHFVTVNRFLRGEQGFSFDLAEKLAAALGLELRVSTARKK